MTEYYVFNNPIVIESDVYFALRQEVEAYRKAIGKLDWQLERRRQYLRSCRKVDLKPDADIVATHDGDVTNAQMDLIEAYEGFLSETYI